MLRLVTMSRIFAALLLGGALLTPATELAAQGQGNRCTISVTGISFGNYSTSATAPHDSQGVVRYHCRGGRIRNIIVEVNAGTSGRISQRTMQGPGGTVRYNLFLDALRHTIWGDGSHGSRTFRTSNIQHNRTVSVPIYARVPAGQPVAAGQYQDTLSVTVLF
jgi:spore coat protein U-like protein